MMTKSQEMQDLLERQKHAQHVFSEMLTAVSPEVKEALMALYDLVEIDQRVARGQVEHS